MQRDEEADRRAEEFEIAGELHQPSGLVLAIDTDRRIHRFAAGKAAGIPGFFQRFGIDAVFQLRLALEVLGLARLHRVDDALACLAGNDVNLPGLKIAAGRRPAGQLQQAPHRAFLNRCIEEGTG